MPDPSVNEVKSLTRIVLRPLGNALPLGFFAFGTGVILMSAIEMHWIPPEDARNVPILLLGFVAPLELLASVIAYLSRDTAAATTLGIFALSWVPQGIVMMRQAQNPSSTEGIFLIMMAAMIAALGAAAYSAKPLLSAILTVTFVRTLCAALVQLGTSKLTTTDAIVGIVLTAMSFYGGVAFLIEDVKQSDILPLFRRGAAENAMKGSLSDQVVTMPNKPGVRRQL